VFSRGVRAKSSKSAAVTFDNVVLRHGPNRIQRYAPAGAHFDVCKTQVSALLAARPELNAPPVLDPETYDFFEALRITKLEDQASQLASQASVASVKATLVFGVDPAAHVPVVQGSRRLLDVADQCERLTNGVVLYLVAAPAKIPRSADIVRLARASGGRITLAASLDGLADWQSSAQSGR
jgi:hypothetical protein